MLYGDHPYGWPGERLAEPGLTRLHEIRPRDAVRAHQHLRGRSRHLAAERVARAEVVRHEHRANRQCSANCSKSCSHGRFPLPPYYIKESATNFLGK